MPNPEMVVKTYLIIDPIPPQTIDSIREEFVGDVEHILQEVDREELLEDKEFLTELEDTFPEAVIVAAIITVVGSFALETYKELVLPKLKEKYAIKEEKQAEES